LVILAPDSVKNLTVARNEKNPSNELLVTWQRPTGDGDRIQVSAIFVADID